MPRAHFHGGNSFITMEGTPAEFCAACVTGSLPDRVAPLADHLARQVNDAVPMETMRCCGMAFTRTQVEETGGKCPVCG